MGVYEIDPLSDHRRQKLLQQYPRASVFHTCGWLELYTDLPSHLRELHATRKLWLALPSEVDSWWRARSKMHLVEHGDDWHIEGEGTERAVVAYARNKGGSLIYDMQPALSRSGLN
jgi:hypothetical protein